jgi:hypothetical protein
MINITKRGKGSNMTLKPIVVLLALSFTTAAAFADDANNDGGPTLTVSGFGTAALTTTSTNQAQFARPNQPDGVGSNVGAGVDSDFGIQLASKINPWLSLTAQGLVNKDASDTYGGQLTWAFAKFKINDDWNIRVGRMELPVYMISDYQNVGYANTMIRPPVEMYTQVTVQNIDGADAIYQHSFGDTTFTAQFGVGSSNDQNSGGFDIKFRDLTALNLVLENGPFTVRFGRVDTKFTVDTLASLNAEVAALNQLGFTQQANELNIDRVHGSFTSIGASLDWNNIVAQAEYGKRKTDVLSVPDTTSWYTMFGYRIGKFLPYYDHASARQDSANTVAGIPAVGPLVPLALGANAFASGSPNQTSNSIGVRWDFYKSVDFKFQIDRVSPDNGHGTFVNAQPGFTGPVTVYAAGIDFVF